MSTDSTCLVARAMPCAIPASQAMKAEFNGPDALIDDLKKLSLNKEKAPKPNKEKKGTRTMDTISPADFVTLQSLRSSALARKTNTTSKMARDGANLFADLLAEDKPVEKKEVTADDLALSSLTLEEKKEAAEKKEEETKAEKAEEKSEKEDAEKKDSADKNDKEAADEKDDKEGELISRGPVRTSRTPMTFHPYGGKTLHYGAAAQSAVEDPTSYSYGYDHNYDYSPNYYNANRDMINSNSSTPDTLFSDNGYSTATSPQNYYNNYYQPPTAPQQAYYPHAAVPVPQAQQPVQQSKTADTPSVGFADPLTSSEINRLLSTNTEGETELPESLSDFILKYSRRYANGSEEVDAYTTIKSSFSPSSSSSSPQHHHRPLSADSGCDSPLSAGSAPQTSPAQPHGGISGPSTPSSDLHRYQSKTGGTPLSVESQQRPAKEKLRALISDDDMDQAWAWTTKCMMYFPGALSYQDPDRDTLLHIVTKLMDFAKIYTLVERMLKLENSHSHKMFDMPNKMNETPLFLAVERRCPEIVEYLLEAGANPNIQTLRHERDASLHYAATRGMYDVVSTLCSSPKTNINAMNGMGLTPLLCAVKNHGSLEEESQRIIDSRMTIQQLLACGADPMIADATNGRTVIHYVVDCTDPALIEIFKANIPEAVMMDLVNTPDLCMETPLNLLQSMVNIDESRRSTLCMELITCGANNQKPQVYEQLY